MIPETLSSKLFSAIGIGVALVSPGDLTLRLVNPTFSQWFKGVSIGDPLADVLDEGALQRLKDGLASDEPFTMDVAGKAGRRTIDIEVTVRQARHDDEAMVLLECQNISRLRQTEAMIDSYAAMVERKERELEREKVQAEKLLLNLMPRSVYEEYRAYGSVMPRLYEPVSVLMIDFVGFTDMAVAADPTVTVSELNDIYTAFDRIAELYGCERIKTLGDAYLAVAGLPHPNPDHVRAAAQCAVKMIRFLKRRNETHPHTWRARIGVATGPVVGSVVGVQKYVYDVFGPAVNQAARLQQCSEPMEITVPKEFASELIDDFSLDKVRTETLRGFGDVQVARLKERRTQPASRSFEMLS
ncbi:MAG: adenylate/guanylate cyclase domain-containing protein [Pseudomonadota bacterium]